LFIKITEKESELPYISVRISVRIPNIRLYMLVHQGDMNDEFAVDESGMTSDGYHILDPVSKRSMYLKNLIVFAILALFFGLGIHYADIIWETDTDLYRMGLLAVFILIAVYLIVSPIVFYRRYRYRLDDDKVDIRRGIITITHTMVPIERIHQVEVSKGPINRMFGLANVNITTAGGTATLEYLNEPVAESIASKLNECVVRLLKDRDQN